MEDKLKLRVPFKTGIDGAELELAVAGGSHW